jgi:hypothetical protein
MLETLFKSSPWSRELLLKLEFLNSYSGEDPGPGALLKLQFWNSCSGEDPGPGTAAKI